ncbi:MAG: hypothetical protein GY792_36740 [Gammaproteobacteria bacterium]|nr:hypothetical protein [Gammaproteobacteria bacterium]
MASVRNFFLELSREIYNVSWTLFKLMIPVILVVKLLQELGGITWLSAVLAPLMALVGLPDSMGLVWATTILTNIYAGMLVFVTQAQGEALSVAQVTVLGGLLLMAHGLPVEAVIARKAGVRLRVTLLLRIGGSLLFAWLLHFIYSQGGWLQHANHLLWRPELKVDGGLFAWATIQLKSLMMIQLIIVALLTGLKILRILKIERLIGWLLGPLLRLLGIGREATTITVIGVTLGLAFGGGLLINEARKGEVLPRDIFTSMTLLGLLHSLIEDTLLVMLLGADISGVLWLRLLFAFLAVAFVARLLRLVGDDLFQRQLFHQTNSGQQR